MNESFGAAGRIAGAIDRIEDALQRMVTQVAMPTGENDGRGALEQALEDERTANAQLTERVRAIKEKQESLVAGLERTVARLTEQLDQQGRELQRQKRVNAQLTETNRALSTAATEGNIAPHLINKAMLSELEALRAARAAEVAEMEEILGELKPLIGEVA
ncbi:MAG: hypothetical protein RLZZ528_2967 [Pseudomonadota bacterium]